MKVDVGHGTEDTKGMPYMRAKYHEGAYLGIKLTILAVVASLIWMIADGTSMPCSWPCGGSMFGLKMVRTSIGTAISWWFLNLIGSMVTANGLFAFVGMRGKMMIIGIPASILILGCMVIGAAPASVLVIFVGGFIAQASA